MADSKTTHDRIKFEVVEAPVSHGSKYDELVSAIMRLPEGKAIQIEFNSKNEFSLLGMALRQRIRNHNPKLRLATRTGEKVGYLWKLPAKKNS